MNASCDARVVLPVRNKKHFIEIGLVLGLGTIHTVAPECLYSLMVPLSCGSQDLGQLMHSETYVNLLSLDWFGWLKPSCEPFYSFIDPTSAQNLLLHFPKAIGKQTPENKQDRIQRLVQRLLHTMELFGCVLLKF